MDILFPLINRLKLKTAIGGYVRINQMTVENIQLIQLRESKAGIDIVDSDHMWDSTHTSIDIQNPTYLSLDGIGIIHKKVKRQHDQDLHAVARQYLPQLNPAELVFQYIPLSGENGILSIARKQDLSQVVEQLLSKGLNIYEIFLGPYTIKNYVELANIELSFDIDLYHIGLADGNIEEIKSTNTDWGNTFQLGQELIKSSEILSYCTALNHYLDNEHNGILEIPEIRKSKKEFQNKYVFKKLINIIPISILLVLLVNFGLYSYLESHNQDLQFQYGQAEAKINKFRDLNKQIEKKKQFFNSLSNKGGLNLPYYADQIGSTLIDGIQLIKLSVYPIDETMLSKSRAYKFDPDMIIIDGYANNTKVMNDWIRKLENLAWVGVVTDPRYNSSPSENRGIFHLTLKIGDSGYKVE